jgi:uncharacterized surface protein with fasciclin (FAS1) repeats
MKRKKMIIKPLFQKLDEMKKRILITLLILSGIYACQDPWTERTVVNDDVPALNLMEEILGRPELSQFAQYLQSTGWDTLLNATKPYTVWAPTNDALSKVGNTIINDEELLRDLVNNHISLLQYEYFTGKESIRIKTFKDKYISLDFVNGKVNESNLLEPYDVVANNGILHIIDQALVPQKNIWEFIETTNLCPKLSGYLNSLTGEIFDPAIATQIGIDASTGKPIYDTASGLIWDNLFLNRTLNLRSEDTLATVFLFSDQDFDSEFDKFREYYNFNSSVENSEQLTDSVTTWKISKDIVFDGAISPGNLPGVANSTFGIDVAIGSFVVDSVFQASNGYVYIVHNYAIEKPDKIPVIILEGEDTTKYIGMDPFGQSGYTRQVAAASGGYDFILDNHGGNPGSLTFHVPDLCKAEYDVYWKAVNDFDYSYRNPDTSKAIVQDLGWVKLSGWEEELPLFTDFGSVINASGLTPPIEVSDSTYTNATEVYLGHIGTLYYKHREWLQLQGESKNSTITVDYIKLVPVFND